MVLEVRAADIIINTAETQTNGGQTLTPTGGDTITVTKDGSITTEGGSRDAPNRAISAFTDGNTISNAGKINTKGPYRDYGIYARDRNFVTNEAGASIRTESNFTAGIRARSDNTITNNGSINTEGREANGIRAQSYNTITNAGEINTKGGGAEGISAKHDNTITNEAGASIRTEGVNATGIQGRGYIQNFVHFGGNDTIRNEGDIQTAGVDAAGIQVVGTKNSVTNTGLITTTGANAPGIHALKTLKIQVSDKNKITHSGRILKIQVSDSKNKITHSGRIQVSGPGSAGILAGNGNELTLSGSITSAQGSALHLGDNNTINHSGNDTLRSTGQNTPAVMMGDGNTLTNTGRIEATGTGANAHAITGGSGNTINNDGIIRANPAGAGRAIAFTGSNNTLNLGPNSRIMGDIDLGRGGQIKVSQAPAVGVLWEGITARPAKGSEYAPFFYNAKTRQLATYDTRALAASAGAGALGDASVNVSGLMARPGLESSANRRSLIPTASGSALWLRTFGSRARYRSQGDLNPEAGHLGLAGGYDLRLNATQFGVLAGYGRGELRFKGAQRFKPGPSLLKGPFAGVYVRRDFAPFSVQVGLSGGILKHTSSRLVNDNRAPNGQARAEARTRSWWLAPEARIGLRLDAGLMQFEPSFTARYAWQSIRGFTETGIRAPATVGQRNVELLETRLELKTEREVGPGRIALKAGWQYRDDLNSNQAQVRLLGESQRVRLESGLGSSLYLGAEAEFELAPSLFLNLSGEAVSGDGYRNMSGMASVYKAF